MVIFGAAIYVLSPVSVFALIITCPAGNINEAVRFFDTFYINCLLKPLIYPKKLIFFIITKYGLHNQIGNNSCIQVMEVQL